MTMNWIHVVITLYFCLNSYTAGYATATHPDPEGPQELKMWYFNTCMTLLFGFPVVAVAQVAKLFKKKP